MAAGTLKEALYGRNPVRECLRANRRTGGSLFLSEGTRHNALIEEIITLARGRGCTIEVRTRGDLAQLARSREHQGVVLEIGPYPYTSLDDIIRAAREVGSAGLILMLDRLQDPQNVGTLLRTAEAVGVQGVILPQRRAVSITPAVAKASAGASEHLSIAQVTNLVPAIAELKQAGFWVQGLEDYSGAALYAEVDWNLPLVVVVGSEGYGLRRLVRERCDGLVRLPMQGQIGSLNAATAGSIVLYEIWRQRSQALKVG